MDGIIYIVVNEAMPGIVKVGLTQGDLADRIKQLDHTSVPLPFECFYAARVNNVEFVEKQLHDAFADYRVRKNREFFEVSPERVVSALKLAEVENVTPSTDIVESDDDQKALNKARNKRAVFNFKLADIPLGAELVFSRDENVKCNVVDNRKVNYCGSLMSLSAAAQAALESLGFNWKAVQGPAYWLYEGETLDERRKRLEESV